MNDRDETLSYEWSILLLVSTSYLLASTSDLLLTSVYSGKPLYLAKLI